MTSPLARYRALDPGERRLFREAWRALAVARLRLRLTSFRSCLTWSEHEPPGKVGDGDEAARVERAVRRAARAVPGARCLAQALAARVLLRRRGLEPELCLGAGRAGAAHFVAHAWLELGGRVVFGDPEPGKFGRFGTSSDEDPSQNRTPTA